MRRQGSDCHVTNEPDISSGSLTDQIYQRGLKKQYLQKYSSRLSLQWLHQEQVGLSLLFFKCRFSLLPFRDVNICPKHANDIAFSIAQGNFTGKKRDNIS